MKWKIRFREMIFQTRRLTSSAGENLVYPNKHGLPASTENVDIKVVSGIGQHQNNKGWVRGWWMTPESYKVSSRLLFRGGNDIIDKILNFF